MKPPGNPDTFKLWQMPRATFNEWRRANDLPRLLAFFHTFLPHFSDWQSEFQLDDARFLLADRPSRFFRGKTEVFFIESTGPDRYGQPETTTSFTEWNPADRARHQLRLSRFPEYKVNWSFRFIPYFHWLRNVKGIRWFKVPGDRNNSYASDFQYQSWQAMGTLYSQASLFHSHQVLKLGSTRISPDVLDERNLDFVCLDDLEITGDGATHSTEIAYSSCNRVSFIECHKAFITFEKCHAEELLFQDSKFQDLHFKDCDRIYRPMFRSTRLFRTRFIRSVPVAIDFDDCEISDLEVEDPPIQSPDLYKRLRVAFQAQGNRREAAHYFYEERFQELLNHIFPIIPQTKEFPSRAYTGPYSQLYDQWLQGRIDSGRILKMLRTNFLSYVKLILYPHYLVRFLIAKSRAVSDAADWAIWGFGEKPGRVFLWMTAIVAFYAARYYYGDIQALHGNAMESFYCSVFNFATTGCDHKRGIDSIEALLGATFLGIMVAGFANRTRY